MINNQKKNPIKEDCPECKGLIILNGHEKVCEICGLVISSMQLIDSYQFNDPNNSEFSSGDQFVSIGNTVDNVCLLGSHIDFYSSRLFFDYKRQVISSKQQNKFKKLKMYYSLPLKIKNHETDYRIMKILNKITLYLKLAEVVKNRAAYFYRIIKKKAPKITNHVSLIGFCIFYASREFLKNAPISLRELCETFKMLGHRISPKLIIRDSLDYKGFLKFNNIHHKSEDYIVRFIDSVVNSQEVYMRMEKKNLIYSKSEYRALLNKKCIDICKILTEKIRGSRNPFILAGAIVYCADKLIAKERKVKSVLTQKVASNAMKIAEYSIRDHYVKILKPIFSP
jgi:transcription initiation factor TFIIIB Brf1 subunit/transcription initiation factor TFIIB